jgi:hypothetical protein
MQDDKKTDNAGGHEHRQCRMTRRQTMQEGKEDRQCRKTKLMTINAWRQYTIHVYVATAYHIWKEFM